MSKSALEILEDIAVNQKSVGTSRLSKLLIDLRQEFEVAHNDAKNARLKMNDANKRVQIVEARNEKLKVKLNKAREKANEFTKVI